MNFPWVICLRNDDATALASLRLSEGIEIAETGQQVWLRSRRLDESLDLALRSLPAIARYEWCPGDRLRPLESRIPFESLPELEWQPLAAWFRVEFPPSALPAALPRAVPLRLVRSMQEGDPSLLMTNLREWSRFARHAAEVRLKPLRFAVNAAGEVLVHGRPLPSVPGQRFVVHQNIAVPAGFTWAPAVSIAVLARRVGVAADALAVLRDDGSVSRIQAEQFVPASRGAISETARSFSPDDPP